MNRPIAVTCLLLSSVFAAGQSEAQSVSEQAAADALFDEGIRLRNSGDHAAACDRFERSQEIDPALGTLQNIGMCLEEQDQLVAALGTFQQLLDEAEGTRDQERIIVSRDKIKDLKKRIPKLHVKVPDASRIDGLEILVNGEKIVEALLGFPTPVDPGSYIVTARAPRHDRWTKTVEVAPSRTVAVVIPALERRKKKNTQTPAPPTLEVDKDKDVDKDKEASDPTKSERYLSVGFSAGVSNISIAGFDLSNVFAVTGELASRVTEGVPFIEVGGMMSVTAFKADGVLGESVTTGLYSVLANVSLVWPTSGRFRYRGQVGAGVMVFTGLDDPGNPLLNPGTSTSATVSVPQVRLTFGVDYQVATWTHFVFNPLAYWYSQSADEFAPAVDGLRGYETTAGVSHLF